MYCDINMSRRYEILNQKLCNNSEGGLGDAEVASDLLRGDLYRLVDEVQDGGLRIHGVSLQGFDVAASFCASLIQISNS